MNKNKKILLDASAVMALLNQEPGHEQVEAVLAHAAISTVNYSEVMSILVRNKMAEQIIDELLYGLIPEVITFTHDIAICTGKLINQTKEYGLSLGDRACIATSIVFKIPIYTADKAWQQLNLPDVEINLIR